MLKTLLVIYLVGGVVGCGICLMAFLRDRSTPKTDVFSWLIVFLAPVIWPIALPLSLRELARKHRVTELERAGDREPVRR